ncbi:MAG: YncE family protein, partial [Muribaculaceae bacterium]|nr:YncE family protein [Muribaculaceae bacterium]
MNKFTTTVSALALILAATGCENDEPEVILPDYQDVKEATADGGNMARLYVLNEGNMGANKATIDFLDYAKGFYCRNTYPENNPTVALELGDTGTDLQINGQRM